MEKKRAKKAISKFELAHTDPRRRQELLDSTLVTSGAEEALIRTFNANRYSERFRYLVGDDEGQP